MKPTSVPILFLIFNRPKPTERVFEEIRKARPSRLFVAADGPRDGISKDVEMCAATRKVVSSVDWPCEVKTLFRKTNLGCKVAVSSAIDWFFGQVDEGIILEDDCLPDQSFFPFCQELLGKYATDEKVMMISGFNASGSWPTKSSYLFSKHTAIWGWATWKRAWAKYDVNIKSWDSLENKKRVKKSLDNNKLWKTKQWTYDQLFAGTKDTWDYQWEYTLLLHEGKCIVPRENLIENIGYGSDGTHATDDKLSLPKRNSVDFPLIHTDAITINHDYDTFFSRRWQNNRSYMTRISDKIKKMLYFKSLKKIEPYLRTKMYMAQVKRDYKNQSREFARLKQNYPRYRPLLVQIGCGPRILKDWVNIDLSYAHTGKSLTTENKKDFYAFDILKNGLPFPDNCVDAVFHEDCIEHLSQKEQFIFLAEIYRVLKPGAVHRVNTPNLEVMKRNSDFKIGKSGIFVSEWDKWGHKNILTPSNLQEMATIVGYSQVSINSRNQSQSKFIPKELRPGAPRTDNTNLFADLIK